MGTLLGDIAFGGNSAFDRQQITDMYKTLGPLAKSATEAGQAGVGDAMAYTRALLHGGQQAQQEAIAPIENAASAQQQQQRRLLGSEGTSRGGGVNAAQQQGADLATHTGVDALTALMPQAARQSGQLGLQETDVGTRAATDLASMAEQERRTNLAHQTAEGQNVASLAGAAAGLIPGGGAPAAFPNLTPGQISGAYGGPTSVATEEMPLPDMLQMLQPQ